jgi:hypothetical protein
MWASHPCPTTPLGVVVVVLLLHHSFVFHWFFLGNVYGIRIVVPRPLHGINLVLLQHFRTFLVESNISISVIFRRMTLVICIHFQIEVLKLHFCFTIFLNVIGKAVKFIILQRSFLLSWSGYRQTDIIVL